VRNLSRVVWSEGMYLGPHHFQAQSRFFEDTIHFAAEALWYCPWGFLGVELNHEALRNGTLLLTHARGVFPDGLTFDMPAGDAVPDPSSVDDRFSPTAHAAMVYLAVPQHRTSPESTALDSANVNGATRYIAEEKLIFDEITGLDEKPVRFGRKNIQFLIEGEKTAGLQLLPIARVLRDGMGHYVYDERFIPPSMRMSASSRLIFLTRRLIEILQQKNEAFTGRVMGFDKQATGISAQQVASFWFLHAVNTALTALRHQYLTAQGHPEELYGEFLKLGGALCTFGLESSPEKLPLYDHLDLESCFETLDDHIRRHLEMVVPTNCVSITLQRRDNYFWEGDLPDTRYFGDVRWYFSINANLGEADLIMLTPQLAKLCSARFVPELVRRALPGMPLTHVSLPPASLSPRIQNQYFLVNRGGPCWDHLVETRRVGVYVPGEIPNPNLELLILLET
jgi:type VI secretion system protein ImpJ